MGLAASVSRGGRPMSTHRAQEEPEKEQNHSARRFCTSFEVMAINGAELATVVSQLPVNEQGCMVA